MVLLPSRAKTTCVTGTDGDAVQPTVPLSVWPAAMFCATTGGCTAPTAALPADAEPAELVAVTTERTFAPTSASFRSSVEDVAPVIACHVAPPSRLDCHA